MRKYVNLVVKCLYNIFLLLVTFQRGSRALPGSSVSAAPGHCGWCEVNQGAWGRCSHHDVGQHLVHPAHGSQHDGRELPVYRRRPTGPGHVAGTLLPERGGRGD